MGKPDTQSHASESCNAKAAAGTSSKTEYPDGIPRSSQPRYVEASQRGWMSSSADLAVKAVPDRTSTKVAERSTSRGRRSNTEKSRVVKQRAPKGTLANTAVPHEKSRNRCHSQSSTEFEERSSSLEEKENKQRRRGKRRSSSKTRKLQNPASISSSMESKGLASSVNSSWMSLSAESNGISSTLDSNDKGRKASQRKRSKSPAPKQIDAAKISLHSGESPERSKQASGSKSRKKKSKTGSRCSSQSGTDIGERTSCSEENDVKPKRRGPRRPNSRNKSHSPDTISSPSNAASSPSNSSWISVSLDSSCMPSTSVLNDRSKKASQRKSRQRSCSPETEASAERCDAHSKDLPDDSVQTSGNTSFKKKTKTASRNSSQSSTDVGERSSCSEGTDDKSQSKEQRHSKKKHGSQSPDAMSSSFESIGISSSVNSSWMSSSVDSTSSTLGSSNKSRRASRRKNREWLTSPEAKTIADLKQDTHSEQLQDKSLPTSSSKLVEELKPKSITKERAPRFVPTTARTWMSNSEHFEVEPKLAKAKSVHFDFWDDPAPLPAHLCDGPGRLTLPGTSFGLLPTTQHVLQRAVEGPPLSSAWIQNPTFPEWFSSRAAPGWFFKVSESVLFHAETSTLWELESEAREESGGPIVRRMDTAGAKRGAVVGFAGLNAYVLLRACFRQWGHLARAKKLQDHCSPQAQLLECVVCLDRFLAGIGSQSGAISCGSCQHMLCIECLSNYAICAVELRQWNVSGLPCPVPECNDCIPGSMVLKVASLTTLQCEEIAMHLCKLLVARPVCCPNPECNAVYDGGQSAGDCPRAVCHECKLEFCRKCRCVWHYGRTCEGKRAEDPLSQIAEELGWRRCANCGTMIERVSGCNHMRCRSCNYSFCYRCGGPFSDGKCVDQNCGIFQERPSLPRRHAASALRALWNASWSDSSSPPPLTEERREFLTLWALRHRDEVDLSLLQRSTFAWMTLPAWQRQLLRESWCPYCQQREPSLEALEIHLWRHCTAQVWTCCGRIFLNAEELDVHLYDRHRNSFS